MRSMLTLLFAELALSVSPHLSAVCDYMGPSNGSLQSATPPVEGVRLEWNIFIGIFENLEKKNAKSMQKHENKLKIL